MKPRSQKHTFYFYALCPKYSDDVQNKEVTIDNLIKNTQKDEYFERIAKEGHALNDNKELDQKKTITSPKPAKRKRQPIQKQRHYLIPHETVFDFDDRDDLHRIKAIIEELQTLPLKRYVNAVSVLFRVLIEACTNHYNEIHGIHARSDKIHVTVQAALDHMITNGKIYDKDAEVLKKFSQKEEILSAHTFHTYVHSHHTTPSQQHLCAMWDSFRQYVQNCVYENISTKSKKAA